MKKEDKVDSIVRGHINNIAYSVLAKNDIKNTDTLEQFNLDTLDMFDLVIALEREFSIIFTDDHLNLNDRVTVQDVIDTVKRLIQNI